MRVVFVVSFLLGCASLQAQDSLRYYTQDSTLHPVLELHQQTGKFRYVGLRVRGSTRDTQMLIRCYLCRKFFLVGEEFCYIVTYADTRVMEAQHAHHDCIQLYQKTKKK
jgi:hypothetical protein